jgi:hypothetical protein
MKLHTFFTSKTHNITYRVLKKKVLCQFQWVVLMVLSKQEIPMLHID